MKGEKDAPVIRDMALWNSTRGKPTRGRQNGKAAKDRRVSELRKEVIRGGGLVFRIACNRDPIEEHLAVASNGNPMAIRAEGGEENIMMPGKSVKAMLTVEGQDEVLGGAGRPATTKEAEGRLLGKEIALEAANYLIRA